MSFVLPLLVLATFAGPAPETNTPPAPSNLDTLFDGFDATLVLYEQHSDQTWIHNPAKSNIGTLPCSTFKIPNTLVGLETGVLKDRDTVIKRDAEKFPEQDWWGKSWRTDQAKLALAFKHSIVWYYCTLADTMTNKVIAKHLKDWQYPVPGNLTSGFYFWIEGNYGVSPVDQVAFLRRFYNQELGLREKTTATMKDIMILEEGDGYRFSGKTGLCRMPDDTKVGWMVGYLEHRKGLYFYALRLEGKEYSEIMKHRKPLVRKLFANMELL
ncbi:class D beta-lactamase [Acanthopleuribacter pedis]|uniref:Beta-lactamase n=1 Tax=Acanthopleuribacter pedis TaxID=442870 RepID=A0A8J7U4D0_9BACT|nr:class D beta-lactamase [Acanthopleuribacter pedis]MBO1321363.1 class D beta-lactamase [Acanthopleuribacter pedis]